MEIREYTEEFFEALRETYYGKEAGILSEYLRGECRMLLYLEMSGEDNLQPGKLAKMLSVSTARVASILRSLENKGLISRRTSPEDKRKVFVNITEKGSEYIKDKRSFIIEYFDGIFGRISDDERVEFIRLIKKLASDE